MHQDEGRQVEAREQHQAEVGEHDDAGERERAPRDAAGLDARREPARQIAVGRERRAELRERGEVGVHDAERDDRRDRADRGRAESG